VIVLQTTPGVALASHEVLRPVQPHDDLGDGVAEFHRRSALAARIVAVISI